MTQQETTEMTQETDTLVHDDEWIDDEDGALSDDEAFEDDEPLTDGEPPTRARRRSVPPLAIGLCAIVIAGLGFIGGVQVQKRSGVDATDGVPAGMAAMMQAGGPSGARAAGSAGNDAGSADASSSTTGEVANVKGSKLYVTTADGSTVEVVVRKTATVQRLAATDVGEIRPGDTVVVSGTTAADGSVKSTAVQATASGVSLLGGFGGRGGGPSGSGAAASGGAAGSGSDAASGAASGGGSGSASDAPAVDQLFESGD